MSIIIKGMKMPKCCGKCPIHYTSDLLGGYEVCGATDTIFNDGTPFCHSPEIDMSTEKLDNCPLVEVPPHGRLIDADAVTAKYAEKGRGVDPASDDYPLYIGICEAIDDAPAIIEAEGEA